MKQMFRRRFELAYDLPLRRPTVGEPRGRCKYCRGRTGSDRRRSIRTLRDLSGVNQSARLEWTFDFDLRTVVCRQPQSVMISNSMPALSHPASYSLPSSNFQPRFVAQSNQSVLACQLYNCSVSTSRLSKINSNRA